MKKILLFLFLTIVGAVQGKEFMPEAFKAEFNQSYMSTIKKKLITNHGILFYKYPGNIRLEITDPDEGLIYVSNAKKSWYYRPPFIPGEPGELSVSPKGNTLVAKFFDGLKNGLRSNKLYEVRDLGEQKFEVNFNKKAAKDAGVKKATLSLMKESEKELTFSKVEKIKLVFNDGKEVDLLFKNIVKVENLPDETFIFKAPDNTNVSHQ